MSRVITSMLTVVTPSAGPVLDLDDVRRHVRAVSDTENALLESWVAAAAAYWEEQTGRPIMRTVYRLWLDGVPATVGTFPARIELPRPPLVSVDSLTYIASDGTETAFTDGASPETALWRAVTPAGLYARRGWVEPLAGQGWPTVRDQADALRIEFTAGYAETAADVPDLIRATLLLLVGTFEQFRSQVHYSEGARLETLPWGVTEQIDAFKWSAQSSQVLRT